MSIGQGGASLTEVVIAVSLMSLAAALGVEGLGGVLARAKGRAAVVELAGELRTARLHATMRRETVRATCEEGHSMVRIEAVGPPVNLLREVDLHVHGVTIENVSGGSTIQFYPSGRVATPTTITLQNRRGERWRLTVTITGRVMIQ